jgi:hypothetical protein
MVGGRHFAVVKFDRHAGGHGVLRAQLDERNGDTIESDGRIAHYRVSTRRLAADDSEPVPLRRRRQGSFLENRGLVDSHTDIGAQHDHCPQTNMPSQ